MKTKTNDILNYLFFGSAGVAGFYIAGFVIPLIIGMIPPIVSYTLCTMSGTTLLILGLIAHNEEKND